MNAGNAIVVGCDHEGCRAASDQYPELRGYARYQLAQLYRGLRERDWLVKIDLDYLDCSTCFCPEHSS